MNHVADISTERLVLAALVKNDEYLHQVIPFLKKEFFQDKNEARIFEYISDYVFKFKDAPNMATLAISANTDETLDETRTEQIRGVINDIFTIDPPNNLEWLKKTSEAWGKERSIYNAMMRGVDIFQGTADKKDKADMGMVPTLLSEALGFCFDSRVGTDFHDDIERRWDYYTNPANKLAFNIDIFNEVTEGGIPRKTLNVLAAGVHVGKSLSLISFAAMYMRLGYNVLYISNEMSEEEVFKRADANILNVEMRNLQHLGKDVFTSRIQALKSRTQGRLKVKEYGPSASSIIHYRHLLNELATKQDFVPDVIMVDYLQITAAASVKRGENTNSYFKVVSEELRAFAKESNTVLWTAAQFNRKGMSDNDADMGDLADSKAIADTADSMWALTRTEELDKLGQLMVKQLKNRFAEKTTRLRFVVGVDTSRQLLFQVDQPPIEELNPDKHTPKSGGRELGKTDAMKAKFARNHEDEDRPINRFGQQQGGGGRFGAFNF